MNNPIEKIDEVLIKGDLTTLNSEERVLHLHTVCSSLGLNPLTQPFEYIKLNGKTILYARKGATDQLRKIHGVDVQIESQETIDNLYCVTVNAKDKTGRSDSNIGVVVLPQNAEYKALAMMKAVTKAKRRVTLDICGLGMMDETEAEDIPVSKQPIPKGKVDQSRTIENIIKSLENKKKLTNPVSKEYILNYPNNTKVPIAFEKFEDFLQKYQEELLSLYQTTLSDAEKRQKFEAFKTINMMVLEEIRKENFDYVEDMEMKEEKWFGTDK